MTVTIAKAPGWFTGAALLAIGCVPTEGSLPGTGILESLGIREPVGEMLADEFLTTDQSAQAYRPCPVRFQFGDGCDRTFLKTFLARTGLCSRAAVIFDGGVNRGQLIDVMRSGCNATPAQPHIYGIEIDPKVFAKTSAKYAEIDTVHVFHLGWSSTTFSSSVDVSNKQSMLHQLQAAPAKSSTSATSSTAPSVNTTTLPRFAQTAGVARASYVVIDVEGHEAHVITGMALGFEANRRMFSAFQYETAWQSNSPEIMGQARPPEMYPVPLARHLVANGYELYLIGCKELWRIAPSFFAQGVGAINLNRHCNRNYTDLDPHGMWLWGNVLALHPGHADPEMVQYVHASATEHAAAARKRLASQQRP